MSISDLNSIKKSLLVDYKKWEHDAPDEYRDGVQGGINVALMRIEQMIEEESRQMEKYYREDTE